MHSLTKQTSGTQLSSNVFSPSPRPQITPNMRKAQKHEVSDESAAAQKIRGLEEDVERRQQSYVHRERAYKARIEELEDEVKALKQNRKGWMKNDAKIVKLQHMQGQILNNIELVQDRTARILQEQERDLLKAFRARLYDVQTELEKEKSRKDDGAGAWIDRCNALTAELERTKAIADRLERVNQALGQEKDRLKSEFTSQEEDRNYLVTQLVTVKKENARIRAEYTALEEECRGLHQKVCDHDTRETVTFILVCHLLGREIIK